VSDDARSDDPRSDGLRSTFPREQFPPAGSAEPYAGFDGVVSERFATSQPWWPPRPDAEGRPNVVVILVDDVGYSDLGCFGSEIDTPNIDALADQGVRLTNFNVTPLCSPTRAALLTGQHTGQAAGVGFVCHLDPGFPGYASEMSDDLATMPEILRDNGYATLMVGKWHLSKDSDLADGRPKHSWPLQKGFERYYGILDGFTNFHHPHRLTRDNSTVEVDRYPDDYYFTDDITDEAIGMVRSVKANDPSRPFFLYMAHGAAHAPLHARAGKIAKYADRYHGGWDALRDERLARMKELRIVPEHTELAARPTYEGYEAPEWSSLPDDQRTVYARYMAVYAAMVEHIDESLGRLRVALEDLGEWDNTIVVFTSDNGASREGGLTGTTSYYTHLGGEIHVDRDLERLALIGGPQTMPHYPQAWAMACNTPYPMYKFTSFLGGRAVATLVSWPERWGRHGGSLRSQYGHASDVLPTILDVLGIDAPSHRGGLPLRPITGNSMAEWLDDPAADSVTDERMFEVGGHRAYRRGRWEIAAFHRPRAPFADHEFQLFDLAADPGCTTDVGHDHPEVVAELAAAWEEAAWDNQVFPLDSGAGYKFLVRPERDEVFVRPVRIPAGTPTLERWRSLELLLFRGCTIEIDLSADPSGGAGGDEQGWLLAHGDQGGGYGICVEDGRLMFVHNDGHGTLRELDAAAWAAAIGKVTVHLNRPPGGKWNVVVEVDGSEVAAEDGYQPLFPMAPFQGIDVGINRRSPVSWRRYEQHGPFAWTGQSLASVTYTPHERPADAPHNWLEQMKELAATYD